MTDDNLSGATDALLQDFCAQTDEDLFRRIWLAAAIIAARGGVLTPAVVLTQVSTKPTPPNWDELKAEIIEMSAPNYRRGL